MKILICKSCGFCDQTSSGTWVVKRDEEDYARLECPTCGKKELLVLKLETDVLS